ncbi:hypothetical protein FHS11_003594 [Mucilaginibacter gotjawali]|uniref:Uncharacterized protein n=1 Tax=Mucilaginibacter gotjawali TaxID=1550579 RepID=A0A839SH51_9SPHI|nr:hypothetical protein [Mucilaginibacter gotjawali]
MVDQEAGFNKSVINEQGRSCAERKRKREKPTMSECSLE